MLPVNDSLYFTIYGHSVFLSISRISNSLLGHSETYLFTFAAYSFPVSISSTCQTYPKLPQPISWKHLKWPKLTVLELDTSFNETIVLISVFMLTEFLHLTFTWVAPVTSGSFTSSFYTATDIHFSFSFRFGYLASCSIIAFRFSREILAMA